MPAAGRDLPMGFTRSMRAKHEMLTEGLILRTRQVLQKVKCIPTSKNGYAGGRLKHVVDPPRVKPMVPLTALSQVSPPYLRVFRQVPGEAFQHNAAGFHNIDPLSMPRRRSYGSEVLP